MAVYDRPMNSLLTTKTVAQLLSETEGEHALKRVLGPLNLIALGVGAVIGAGIFVITGSAAAQFAGPAIGLSFVLAGLGCAFAGLCYAELASMIPVAGSAYTYAYASMGEWIAWIIGWDLVLEYAFSAATVASGWSANMVSLLQDFGIRLPARFTDVPANHAVFNTPAFLIVLFVSLVLVVGVRESANVNIVVVFIKVTTAVTFVIVAAGFLLKNPEIAHANWTPFIPPNTGHFGQFGWSGIARGAASIFFAYIGFDAVSTAAQEARHPQRDMPIGILASLAICTVLYLLVAVTLTGVVHYDKLNVAAPVAVAIDATGAKWGSLLIKAGTLAGLSTVMLTTLLGQSRIFYVMSKDGLLPGWAGAIHPRFRTPWISSLAVGLFIAVCAGFLPLSTLGDLVNIGTLFAFIIVCVGVWILRYKRPDLDRPFRTPAVPIVPLLGVLISLLLMASLPMETWLRLIIWLIIGQAVYFGYGRYHARTRGRELHSGIKGHVRNS
jgi:APA family basic amino acid/polyamine antiporter